MSKYSDLEIRMRGYEEVADYKLTRRMPVIIRLDGRSAHTFCRGFSRPFDKFFREAMRQTMKYLCGNIQGCVFGYTDSDEISLVLIDYQTLNSDCWFGNRIQKITSIAASIATLYFNREFKDILREGYREGEINSLKLEMYEEALRRGLLFDARAFNLPREEVTNYLYCRQRNAERNSIQSCGQFYFSHKQLEGKSCNEIQDMLMTQCGFNWNDVLVCNKRGSCCYRRTESDGTHGVILGKGEWYIDKYMPRLVGDGRELVEDLIKFPGEEREYNNNTVSYVIEKFLTE